MSTAEKLDTIPSASEEPKKNAKTTKPAPTAEEKAQLEAELQELLSKVKTTGDMKWDDELHYGWGDDATAKRLAEVQAHGRDGNTLAWDPTASGGARGESGAWRTWDGNRWKLDTNNKIGHTHGKTVAHACRQRAQEWLAYMTSDVFPKLPKKDQEYIKRKVGSWTGYSAKAGNTLGMSSGLTFLRSEPGMTPDVEWDNNPNLLATPYGTVELDGDWGTNIRDARRTDWITRSTATGVTALDYKCGDIATQFEKLLEQALPNPAVRRYFQKCMGYTLVGNNHKRKFIVLHGPTSSGKSTVLQIIAGVLGDYAAPFKLSLFRSNKDEKPRPDVIRAMNSRLIFSSEASTEWELHADQIKSLTGGDSVGVRDLYGNANDMTNRTPEFTPVLATNAVPTIIDADEALWRRFVVFHFGNTIDARKEDTGLATRIIHDEGPAVFTWLLDGWTMYHEGEELEDGEFIEPGLDDVPSEVITATMAFRSNLTTADQHIYSDHVRRDPGNREVHEKAATLYANYRQWCTDTGIPAAKIQAKTKYLEALDRAGHVENKYEVASYTSDGITYKARQYRARAGIAVNTEHEMNASEDAKLA